MLDPYYLGPHLALLSVIFVILGKLEGQFLPDKCFWGVKSEEYILGLGFYVRLADIWYSKGQMLLWYVL